MKKKHVVLITVITAVTVFVGSYVLFSSLMLTDSVGEHVDVARAGVAQDEDLESLMNDIETLNDGEAEAEVVSSDRDPLVPYEAPKKATAAKPAAPPKPRKPELKVSAVILDEDTPTAIVIVGGQSRIVQVGDEVVGGRVTEITNEGITVETAERTYEYSYASRS